MAPGINSVRSLKGKRRWGSAEAGLVPLFDARLILAAFGMSERDLQATYVAVCVADALKDGTIDAFFNVSGWPQSAVVDLAGTIGIDLVPIDGPEVEAHPAKYRADRLTRSPTRHYRGVGVQGDRRAHWAHHSIGSRAR